jgi:hypothetical protein
MNDASLTYYGGKLDDILSSETSREPETLMDFSLSDDVVELKERTERLTVFGTVHAPFIPPLIAAKEFVTADHIGEVRFGPDRGVVPGLPQHHGQRAALWLSRAPGSRSAERAKPKCKSRKTGLPN